MRVVNNMTTHPPQSKSKQSTTTDTNLRVQLPDSRELIARQSEQLKSYERKFMEMQQSTQELRQVTEELQRENAELRMENDELTNDIQDSIHENEEIKQQIDDVVEKLNEMREDNEQLQAEKEVLAEKVEQHLMHHQTYHCHCTEGIMQLCGESSGVSEKKNARRSSGRDNIADMTNDVSGLMTDVKSRMRRQLMQASREVEKLEETCSKLRSEREDLREEMAKLADTKLAAENKAEETDVVVKQLQLTVDSLCTEKVLLEKRLGQLMQSNFFISRSGPPSDSEVAKGSNSPSTTRRASMGGFVSHLSPERVKSQPSPPPEDNSMENAQIMKPQRRASIGATVGSSPDGLPNTTATELVTVNETEKPRSFKQPRRNSLGEIGPQLSDSRIHLARRKEEQQEQERQKQQKQQQQQQQQNMFSQPLAALGGIFALSSSPPTQQQENDHRRPHISRRASMGGSATWTGQNQELKTPIQSFPTEGNQKQHFKMPRRASTGGGAPSTALMSQQEQLSQNQVTKQDPVQVYQRSASVARRASVGGGTVSEPRNTEQNSSRGQENARQSFARLGSVRGILSMLDGVSVRQQEEQKGDTAEHQQSNESQGSRNGNKYLESTVGQNRKALSDRRILQAQRRRQRQAEKDSERNAQKEGLNTTQQMLKDLRGQAQNQAQLQQQREKREPEVASDTSKSAVLDLFTKHSEEAPTAGMNSVGSCLSSVEKGSVTTA